MRNNYGFIGGSIRVNLVVSWLFAAKFREGDWDLQNVVSCSVNADRVVTCARAQG